MKKLLIILLLSNLVVANAQILEADLSFIDWSILITNNHQIRPLLVFDYEDSNSIFVLINENLGARMEKHRINDSNISYYFWHKNELFTHGIGCYLEFSDISVKNGKAKFKFKRGFAGNNPCSYFDGSAICEYINGNWKLKKIKVATTTKP